jgi:hypothetical protein
MTITYEWRGAFDNDAINALHAEAFAHRVLADDWQAQVRRQGCSGWRPIRPSG